MAHNNSPIITYKIFIGGYIAQPIKHLKIKIIYYFYDLRLLQTLRCFSYIKHIGICIGGVGKLFIYNNINFLTPPIQYTF